MEKLLRDMPFFVEVARQKSFTLAAEILDVPVSTLSRRIKALEKELGVSLFRRNTRRVELTEGGADFFESCSYILAEAASARDNLLRELKSPAGPVRLAVPHDIFHGYMHNTISEFASQYPDIEIHVSFTNRWTDLMTEPFDLDIRVGALPDSNLRSRRLTSGQKGVYASPVLLEFYPLPQEPEDLLNMPCIFTPGPPGPWMMHKGEEVRKVAPKFKHYPHSMGLGLEFALAGLGVTLLPPQLVAPFERHGLIRRILPEWSEQSFDVSLVMTAGQLPHRVRLFVDYLAAHFANLQNRHMLDLEPLVRAAIEEKRLVLPD